MRKLSTNLTLFWRFFAMLWILYFLFSGAYGIYNFSTAAERDFDVGKLILFILFGLMSSIFVHFVAGKLKNVFLDGDMLIVSNFVKQISVPLSAVSHVDNPDLSSLRRIKIIFCESTDFGSEIVFAPPMFEAKIIAELLKSKIQTNYLSL